MPGLYEGLMQIKSHLGTPHEEDMIEQIYRGQESISIDYGVMEKSHWVLVLPTRDMGWSDVGDWTAFDDLLRTDDKGNAIQAQHLGLDTKGSVVFSKRSKLIATLGVSDLVIVDTDEMLLVMDKSRSQDVKELMQKQTGDEEVHAA